MVLEQEQVKLVGDVLSVSTVVATIVGWLPAIAAVFSIVWTSIQIYNWWKKDK